MKVNIEFDLKDEEDRKLYGAYRNMREISLNFEALREKLKELMRYSYLIEDTINQEMMMDIIHNVQTFFDEMVWKKLT